MDFYIVLSRPFSTMGYMSWYMPLIVIILLHFYCYVYKQPNTTTTRPSSRCSNFYTIKWNPNPFSDLCRLVTVLEGICQSHLCGHELHLMNRKDTQGFVSYWGSKECKQWQQKEEIYEACVSRVAIQRGRQSGTRRVSLLILV